MGYSVLETDVLILGSGLAGSLTAYALAKKGIKVTLVSPKPLEELPRPYADPIGHLIQPQVDPLRCSRAFEYLNESHEEMINQFLSVGLLSNPVEMFDDIICKIQDSQEIHKLFNHIAVELITLEHHSLAASDIYKKPTCLGAYLMDCQTEEMFPVFAKETIIATGGYEQLYLYSSNPNDMSGSSIALGHQAGARILNLGHIEFYPAAVKHGDCYHPIPYQILNRWIPKENPKALSSELFLTSKKTGISHALMKLTFDEERMMEKKHLQTFQVIKELGIDPYKEAFPVTPIAEVSYGGIVVDKVAQTSVQRLRAIGSAACTGIHGLFYDRSASQKECVVWSLSCAEDIAGKIRKFAYYFPKIKSLEFGKQSPDNAALENNHILLKRMMWDYAGINTNAQSLKVINEFVHQMSYEVNRESIAKSLSVPLVKLRHALSASQLLLRNSLSNFA